MNNIEFIEFASGKIRYIFNSVLKCFNTLLENYIKRKREMSLYFLVPLGFNSISYKIIYHIVKKLTYYMHLMYFTINSWFLVYVESIEQKVTDPGFTVIMETRPNVFN
jgi:hypothetical protein